jgi:hypothetical protein
MPVTRAECSHVVTTVDAAQVLPLLQGILVEVSFVSRCWQVVAVWSHLQVPLINTLAELRFSRTAFCFLIKLATTKQSVYLFFLKLSLTVNKPLLSACTCDINALEPSGHYIYHQV